MCWKMRWTTTSEQHCWLQLVGSFSEKHGRKNSTPQAHVASSATAPLLHPQSKNLPRRATQRQQRQFKKEKKKERSNLFRVLPVRNWTVRGQDRSWVAIQLQIASLVTTGNALREKSLLKQPVRRAQNMALNEVHSVRRATYKQDQQWRTARRRLWKDVCDFTDGCLRNGWV